MESAERGWGDELLEKNGFQGGTVILPVILLKLPFGVLMRVFSFLGGSAVQLTHSRWNNRRRLENHDHGVHWI